MPLKVGTHWEIELQTKTLHCHSAMSTAILTQTIVCTN